MPPFQCSLGLALAAWHLVNHSTMMDLSYLTLEPYVTGAQLVFAMLGMGATLTLGQFREIMARPKGIAFVLVIQYLLLPLAAMLLASLVAMRPEIAFGLVLLASLPSGSFSNIFTYLGKGNLPLSITATCASTAACLVVTPLVLRFFGSAETADHIEMPVGSIVSKIALLLLLPLVVGMGVSHYGPRYKRPFADLTLRTSFVFLACVVIGSLTSGRIDIGQYGWSVPFWIVVYITASLIGGSLVASALKFDNDDAYTLAVEVAMRNANLGIALCALLFPYIPGGDNRWGSGSLYVCLFSGGAMLVICGVAIVRRRLRRHRQARETALSGRHRPTPLQPAESEAAPSR